MAFADYTVKGNVFEYAIGIFAESCYKLTAKNVVFSKSRIIMRLQQLKSFKKWFLSYVSGFYGGDGYVNANLKLKEQHSLRVCKEMLYLVKELGLEKEQRLLAETIALFHDVGRFKQFVRYKTYTDHKSIDHSLLGVKVLRETNVLDGLQRNEKLLIRKAIEYHGRKELPGDLDGDCLLYCQLIRDADKLDVYYTVAKYCRQYRKNPAKFSLELEFPDKPTYSAGVVEDILRGRRTNYNKLRTLNDMRLLQLGWVYDVNFAATLKRIKRRRFLEEIFSFLPETREIEKVKETIYDYVNLRIKKERKL
jgi:putative nucleotidyltransferase with HDIG domain